MQRRYCNALKHATEWDGKKERDDQETLERFSDEKNDHVLWIGWHDYRKLTGKEPIEAQVFEAWYFAKYPSKFHPEVPKETYQNLFPSIDAVPRSEQKSLLRQKIQGVRTNSVLINDPKTEVRPLILPSQFD